MNFRLLHGVNEQKDVENVDPFSFQFHGPKKAMFYTLLKLIKPIPDEVLDQLQSPLAKAMVRAYRHYLTMERQEWRRDVMIRVMPFLICLIAEEGDPNYNEVAASMFFDLVSDWDAGLIEIPLNPLYGPNWWCESLPCRNLIEITYQGKSTTNKVIPRPEIGEMEV
jgi:hypothetical protein